MKMYIVKEVSTWHHSYTVSRETTIYAKNTREAKRLAVKNQIFTRTTLILEDFLGRVISTRKVKNWKDA